MPTPCSLDSCAPEIDRRMQQQQLQCWMKKTNQYHRHFHHRLIALDTSSLRRSDGTIPQR